MAQIKLRWVIFVIFLCGCVPQQAKNLVRDNHAITYVLNTRLNSQDPKQKLTQEELEQYLKISASAWESMDRMLNDWKPGAVEAVNVEGKPIK